jgi:alkylhydroperoxidase family enzyme
MTKTLHGIKVTPPTPYTAEVAVPLPDEGTIRQVVGPSYDPAKALNVMKMFAGTEDMFPAMVGIVTAVFSARGVDPKTRQMIILRAAKVLNSPYEWQANLTLSMNNGLTSEDIEAAAADGPVVGVHADYVLVCRATDEMANDGTLTDGTLSKLIKRYGDVLASKHILIIAWFNMLSLFLNGCRVPMETTDKVGSHKSPLG